MVSIIIPTYNRADLLERAIKSVLAQTFTNWELLIIDDGSTDNTKSIIEKYLSDKRIKYIYQENKGPGAARNNGIRQAGGEFIAFLDSDDSWKTEKIEKQVKILEENKNYDFCFTADILNKEGEIIEKHYKDIKNLPSYKLSGKGISVPSSHLYRTESFKKIGFFDESRDLIGLEDNEWSIRGYALNGFYLDEALTEYYLHSGQITQTNMSARLEKQIRTLSYIIRKNISILKKHPASLLFRIAQIFYLKLKHAIRI